MVVFPNAKINLGLSITEKRKDGFHNLESCFYPVQWIDALEVLPSDTIKFTSSGTVIPGNPEDNLCIKIYHILKNDFDLPPIHLHLHKNIPIGAGLGGGSADAAFTIKLLNSLFDLKLSDDKMESYIRPLGSDCAFFIRNKPVFAYGKGDQFSTINVDLSGKHIVLLYPEVHISTKEAYSGVEPKIPEHSIKDILSGDIHTWKGRLKNDFEKSIFEKYPALLSLKNDLYKHGAVYASMSGSGSCLYGIYENKPDTSFFQTGNGRIWEGIL
jgi:4-diphosphocytidyl-2-C-methyl-D-erythritol kinase